MRHDLAPVKASQITGVRLSDVSVCDHEVLPSIVIEIDEPATPSPTAHGHTRRLTNVVKGARTGVEEK
jgi:hypothetical protein